MFPCSQRLFPTFQQYPAFMFQDWVDPGPYEGPAVQQCDLNSLSGAG